MDLICGSGDPRLDAWASLGCLSLTQAPRPQTGLPKHGLDPCWGGRSCNGQQRGELCNAFGGNPNPEPWSSPQQALRHATFILTACPIISTCSTDLSPSSKEGRRGAGERCRVTCVAAHLSGTLIRLRHTHARMHAHTHAHTHTHTAYTTFSVPVGYPPPPPPSKGSKGWAG